MDGSKQVVSFIQFPDNTARYTGQQAQQQENKQTRRQSKQRELKRPKT
jgi:hypothetical protein